jgi:GH25 family lysozyme M1 (1,4-beta-N-acetylmuramidase)
MSLRCALALAPVIVVAAACGDEFDVGEDAVMGAGITLSSPSSDEQAVHAVCGSGSTVKGIDVSKWQGTINWSAVAGDGVKLAFIRVSDGTG